MKRHVTPRLTAHSPRLPLQVRKLLKDIVKRVAPEKAYLDLQPQLQRVAAHLLEACRCVT